MNRDTKIASEVALALLCPDLIATPGAWLVAYILAGDVSSSPLETIDMYAVNTAIIALSQAGKEMAAEELETDRVNAALERLGNLKESLSRA